jgi:glycosyltransferase involved in cell wall biosynthesis
MSAVRDDCSATSRCESIVHAIVNPLPLPRTAIIWFCHEHPFLMIACLSKAISVCAWVLYPEGTCPGQRYRIEQWQEELQRHNITVDYFPFADHWLMQRLYQPGQMAAKTAGTLAAFARRMAHLLRVRSYDVVYLYRAAGLIGPAALEMVLDNLGRPIVLDFDDAIYLTDTSRANRSVRWLKCAGKTSTLCRLSDKVVVGNEVLADYARAFNPAVTVIPSSVDTTRYRPQKRQPTDSPLVIGWTGSRTTLAHLEQFAPVLRELVRHEKVEIRVHADRPPHLPGVPFVWRPWSVATEIEELSQFDIGLMPLPNDPWSLGKCSMKALLCMAMGTPVVCAPVGMNCQVIQHGENGFLASSPEDWLEHLKTLIHNPTLRQLLGAAGRKTVEMRYSTWHCASLFADVIRSAASCQHPQPLMK